MPHPSQKNFFLKAAFKKKCREAFKDAKKFYTRWSAIQDDFKKQKMFSETCRGFFSELTPAFKDLQEFQYLNRIISGTEN